MSQLSALSKLNTAASIINALREEGRSRAATWLDDNYRSLGRRSSFNLSELLR